MSTVFIIGNGIGMALDRTFFSLKEAFKKVWDEHVATDQQIFINAIMGKKGPPQDEDDLRHIQSVCMDRFKIDVDDNIAKKIELSLMRVATHFFDADAAAMKDKKMLVSLCEYIKREENRGSSIATLNYDKLLYGNFNRTDCDLNLSNYLRDGFLYGKFERQENEKLQSCKGWLLYLHGSPLFYSKEV